MSKPDPTTPRRVTLASIARDLGVTTATVSNAFNRPDQLSAALRERIVARAAELGYDGPDPTARSLRRGTTGAIGVPYNDLLSYAFVDPAFTGFLAGVADELASSGLAMLLLPGAPYPATDADAVRNALIDGAIIYSMAASDPVARAVIGRRLPTVTVDGPETPGVPHVGIDDRSGASAIAEILTTRGHRRFGVLSLHITRDRVPVTTTLDRAERTADQDLIRARLVGYADALRATGLDPSTVPVVACAENTEHYGRLAAAELVETPTDQPSALLAMTDRLGIGSLDAVREIHGVGAVAVAGFDDIPAATGAGLTSVRQPHGDKGRAAGRLLLASLRGEPVDARTILPVEIVRRASTG